MKSFIAFVMMHWLCVSGTEHDHPFVISARCDEKELELSVLVTADATVGDLKKAILAQLQVPGTVGYLAQSSTWYNPLSHTIQYLL